MTSKDNLRALRQVLVAAREKRVVATIAGTTSPSAEGRLRRVQRLVSGLERVMGVGRRADRLNGAD